MKNVAVRPGVGALALAGMSVASAAVIAAVPTVSQAATIAANPVAATTAPDRAATVPIGAAATATESTDTESTDTEAAVDPTQIYADAIERALANIEELQAGSSDKAFPILSQILQNQLNVINGVASGAINGEWKEGKSPNFPALWKEATASITGLGAGLAGAGEDVADALRNDVPPLLEAVTNALQDGDIESAMNNMLLVAVVPIFAAINPSSGPLLPALGKILDVPLDLGLAFAGAIPNDQISSALSEPFNAGKRVVGQLQEVALFTGMGIISPLGGGIGALGHAVQTVVDGVAAGDMDALASALLQAPGVMLDGLLNGGYGPSVGNMIGLGDYPVVNGGLLGPKLNITFDDGQIKIFLPGTLGALQYIQQRIAGVLAPVPPTTSQTVDASAVVSSPLISAAHTPASAGQAGPGTTARASDDTASESAASASKTSSSGASENATSGDSVQETAASESSVSESSVSESSDATSDDATPATGGPSAATDGGNTPATDAPSDTPASSTDSGTTTGSEASGGTGSADTEGSGAAASDDASASGPTAPSSGADSSATTSSGSSSSQSGSASE